MVEFGWPPLPGAADRQLADVLWEFKLRRERRVVVPLAGYQRAAVLLRPRLHLLRGAAPFDRGVLLQAQRAGVAVQPGQGRRYGNAGHHRQRHLIQRRRPGAAGQVQAEPLPRHIHERARLLCRRQQEGEDAAQRVWRKGRPVASGAGSPAAKVGFLRADMQVHTSAA